VSTGEVVVVGATVVVVVVVSDLAVLELLVGVVDEVVVDAFMGGAALVVG
jgi:hypothetical protein